jgi:hypothetical protein
MRLTADQIKEAFVATGMRPIRKSFGDRSVGCGMQAYAHAHKALYDGSTFKVSMLATGKAYFEGFTTGWDYAKSALSDDRVLKQYGGPEGAMRYYDGVEDGRNAAAAMFAKELVTA